MKSEGAGAINVIIADDHMHYRAAVKFALSSKKDIKVIAEADNGSELLILLKAIQPDVILLDLQMPVMDGIATLPEIKKLYPNIRTIMFGMTDDQRMITKLMELGANSYLLKTSDSEIIYEAIKTCYEHEFYFNALTNKALLNDLREKIPSIKHYQVDEILSQKEITVLRLMHEEKSNFEIGEVELNPRTIEAIRDKLKTKTELLNKKYPNRCPVSHDNRISLEKSFSLLLDIFDKEKIRQTKILIPHHSNFPIKYNGDAQTAFDTLKIVAEQMDVEFDEIRLNLYDEGANAISTTSTLGERFFLNSDGNDKGSAGLYWGRQTDNKYHIGLERRKLTQPESMIATLAHELAHIKLLGENKIEVNDEKLTDLTTVIFGMGIFNANTAFQTIRSIDSIGWRKMGYLTQMEWGYALSLLAYIRDEKTPNWIEYLKLSVKEEFKQGERFIENNKDLIFFG